MEMRLEQKFPHVERDTVRENERTAADRAKQLFDKVIIAAASFIREEKTATADTYDRAVAQKAADALSRFYAKAKRISPLLPILFMGGGLERPTQQEERVMYTQEIQRDGKLPFSLAMVDKYLSENVIDTFNTCVRLKEKRVDGKMSEEEIRFKEDFSQRILPWTYEVDFGGLSRLEALEGPNIYTKDYYEKFPGTHGVFKVRMDLFRMYLGLPQYFDSLKKSDYAPSKGEDENAEYFQFDSVELVKSIELWRKQDENLPFKNLFSEMGYEGSSFDDLVSFVTERNVLPKNTYSQQLGRYRASVGFDTERNEPYVSYYDYWDMDPPQLLALGMDVDQFNFPFEIYGRIYRDDVERARVEILAAN